MNVADVQRALDAIRALAGDPESAHWEEDYLYRALLESIASGTCDNPVEAARLALTAADMDFPRWYA